MNDKTVILLTACISPGGMAYTALQDSNERKRLYVDATKFYIDSINYPIVFCNNSGENLSVDFPDCRERVEFLSFFGNDYDKQLGKGYGEYKIIEYALHNRKHLQDASRIIKITGRLKIFDLETQIRVASICYFFDSSYILVADFSQKERFARSECIIAKKDFFEKYFLVANNINDSQNYYFEHLLFDVAVTSPYEPKRFCLLLGIEGVSGSTEMQYSQSKKSNIEQLQYLRNYLLHLASQPPNNLIDGNKMVVSILCRKYSHMESWPPSIQIENAT